MADLITVARAKYNLANMTTSAAEDTTLAALVSACSEAIIRYCGNDFATTTRDERHDGSPDDRLVLRHYPVVEVKRVATAPTPVLRVRNTSTSNQRATVAVLVTGLKLVRVASGATTTDTTVTWSGNATLDAVAAAVNALGNGWAAEAFAGHGLRASADLFPDVSARHCSDRWAELRLHLEDVNDWSANTECGWLMRSGGWPADECQYRVIYDSGYATIPADVQEACAEWVAALFWLTKTDPAASPGLPPESVRRLLLPHRRRHF